MSKCVSQSSTVSEELWLELIFINVVLGMFGALQQLKSLDNGRMFPGLKAGFRTDSH